MSASVIARVETKSSSRDTGLPFRVLPLRLLFDQSADSFWSSSRVTSDSFIYPSLRVFSPLLLSLLISDVHFCQESSELLIGSHQVSPNIP